MPKMEKHTIEGIQREFHRRADAGRFFNRLENPWIQRREESLARRLALLCPEAGSVLEVGCGEGSNLYYLKKQIPQARFTGVDFSQEKVDFARQFLQNMEFHCANALELPFPDSSFDLVFCRDLLHHVDFNRAGVIREMQRVLKPQGILAVCESRGRAPLSLIFQALYPAERGLWHSTPETLLGLAGPYGRGSLDFMEASFCVRAAAFFLGWPRGAVTKKMCSLVYGACDFLERILTRVVPRRLWTYMLLAVRKGMPPL